MRRNAYVAVPMDDNGSNSNRPAPPPRRRGRQSCMEREYIYFLVGVLIIFLIPAILSFGLDVLTSVVNYNYHWRYDQDDDKHHVIVVDNNNEIEYKDYASDQASVQDVAILAVAIDEGQESSWEEEDEEEEDKDKEEEEEEEEEKHDSIVYQEGEEESPTTT